jgi:hypothetical protein
MVPKHVAFAPGNKWCQINGARPHFLKKRTFSYRKWGLAPFIPTGDVSIFSFLEEKHIKLRRHNLLYLSIDTQTSAFYTSIN